jgi:hypothetical protein
MTTHQPLPEVFPPTVDAPFATWYEHYRWIGHPTIDAAAQYSRRYSVSCRRIWERIESADGSICWQECDSPRRPYGARSGKSYLERMVVLMPTSLLRELDEQRGRLSRSAFAREAVERLCVSLRGNSSRQEYGIGRLVSCQDAHGERENVRNGTNEACKLCACSVAAPGCMLVP